MKTFRILILEDDNETVTHLLRRITELERERGIDIAVTVLAEYTQVEEYINKVSAEYFDVILLDRDCKAAGSFHVLDIEKFTPDRIIGISSTPPYNEDLRKRGVKKIVWKDYQNLEDFSQKVIDYVREVVIKQTE